MDSLSEPAKPEPTAINFGSKAPVESSNKIQKQNAPTALSFGEKPTPRTSAASAKESPNPAPGPLTFPPSTQGKGRPPAAATASLQAVHPLHSTLLDKGKKEGNLSQNQELILARFLSQLLPLNLAALENYAQRPLEKCRGHALATSQENNFYSQLGVSARLQEVLNLTLDSVSFFDRLKLKLTRASNQPSTHTLEVLRAALDTFIQKNRKMQPLVAEDKMRLDLAVLALQVVARATPVDNNPSLERALAQRLSLLESAATQAKLIEAQLKALEETASSHIMECDRILSVAISASTLASQLKAKPYT